MSLLGQALIGSGVVWLTAIIGIFVMKKIEPDEKIYAPYAIMICILTTVFLALHVFARQR